VPGAFRQAYLLSTKISVSRIFGHGDLARGGLEPLLECLRFVGVVDLFSMQNRHLENPTQAHDPASGFL
jgi:hypothetical protein